MGTKKPRAGWNASQDTPGAVELAQLREVTRAAHEATQEARAAIKELRAARAEFEKITEDKIGELALPRIKELAAYIEESDAALKKRVDSAARVITDEVGHLLGCRSYVELLDRIAEKLKPSITRAAAEAVAGHMPLLMKKYLPEALLRLLPKLLTAVVEEVIDMPSDRARKIVTNLEFTAHTLRVTGDSVTASDQGKRNEAQR